MTSCYHGNVTTDYLFDLNIVSMSKVTSPPCHTCWNLLLNIFCLIDTKSYKLCESHNMTVTVYNKMDNE